MRKRILTSFCLLVISSIVAAQTIADVKQKADSISKTAALLHGHYGFYAEYADSGEEIINFNGEKALAPASCLKLLTSSAALAGLGEDFRFNTKLYYDGDIDSSGVLKGSLYIVGDGDPALGSNQVKGSLSLDSLMKLWVTAVKAKGIKTIASRVYADAAKYGLYTVPDYWPWIDIGNYYGAGTTALCINDNLYHLYFKPGKNEGEPAEVLRTEPEIKWLCFSNFMKTGKEGSGDNGYIYSSPYDFDAILKGTVPAGVNEFSIKGSIPDPPLFAARFFSKALFNNGVGFAGNADAENTGSSHLSGTVKYDRNKLLCSYLSPPLKDIVYIINKKSNNLYTEQVLLALAYKRYQEGTTEKGTEALLSFMNENNLPVEGIYLHDGCGLSRFDAITAKALGKLLSFNTRQPYFASFYNSLGIAGDTTDISSFKNFGKNTIIAKNARIKDGLINHVRSHSGYVTSKSGRLISFSFIANNYDGPTRAINAMHAELITKLAELK